MLSALLRFTAAVNDTQRLPPGDYVSVKYHDVDDTTAMLTASTCTLSMYLPTVHASYQQFRHHFLQALQLGLEGFGMM